MKKVKLKKKKILEERVEELEVMVRWLNWLIDKHVYDTTAPVWYNTSVRPDPITGWKVT